MHILIYMIKNLKILFPSNKNSNVLFIYLMFYFKYIFIAARIFLWSGGYLLLTTVTHNFKIDGMKLQIFISIINLNGSQIISTFLFFREYKLTILKSANCEWFNFNNVHFYIIKL